MRIQMYGYPLAVGHLFGTILGVEIAKADVRPETGACIMFRDSSYSAETGGFHPVEVAVGSDGRIRSIADFSYGGMAPAAELVKELEFDFMNNRFTQYGMVYPHRQGRRPLQDMAGQLLLLLGSRGVRRHKSGGGPVPMTERRRPIIDYETLADAFADVEEALEDDVSAVRVNLFRDVHFDDFEMEAQVFGRDSATDEAPVFHKAFSPSDAGMDEDRMHIGEPIDPRTVLDLFDGRFLRLLLERGVFVEWNSGEESEAIICPAGGDHSPILRPEDR